MSAVMKPIHGGSGIGKGRSGGHELAEVLAKMAVLMKDAVSK